MGQMDVPFRDNDVLGPYNPTTKLLQAVRTEPCQTVLCHGCFDLLHLGHIQHLQEAKKFGDFLTVSVTGDRYVNKGLGRPHFNAAQRAEALRALACVDAVFINESADAVDMIDRIKPAFYVKGVDYVGSTDEGLERERAAIAKVGGKIKFTGSRKWSSSQIINTEKFSEEVCQYLDTLKNIDARDKIFEAFEKADQKVITFVGESITDQYIYVRGLGRASKELMLATVVTGQEMFAGGVTASAKHGEWRNTHVVTAGEIIKTRYVDADFNRKLFDIYSRTDVDLTHEERHLFRDLLTDVVPTSGVIIVNDFGHGLMGSIERNIVQDAGFLALNCQTNAGNYGFNLVPKYKNAHYVCIDDPEARLAVGMQPQPISEVAAALFNKIDSRKFLITHGRFGSAYFANPMREAPAGLIQGTAPALAQGGIDTMGAGDAVMAVTAPLVASGLDLASAAFVGNIVGAIKVSILGHRRHVGRQEILQTVEALLA